jgi:hypothetical protein
MPEQNPLSSSHTGMWSAFKRSKFRLRPGNQHLARHEQKQSDRLPPGLCRLSGCTPIRSSEWALLADVLIEGGDLGVVAHGSYCCLPRLSQKPTGRTLEPRRIHG